jgi:hypothetical protein
MGYMIKHMQKKERIFILLWVIASAFILYQIITRCKYFMLDLPTYMLSYKMYGLFKAFSLDSGGARYRPLNIFLNSWVTFVFGNNAQFQWLFHYLSFIIFTVLTWKFLKKYIDGIFVYIPVLLLYVITPATENIFTLGKQEILLCVFLTVVIFLMFQIFIEHKELFGKHGIILYIALLLLFMTKETSLVIFSQWGLIILWYLFQKDKQQRKKAIELTIIFILSYGSYYLLKKNALKNSNVNYTNFTISFNQTIHNIYYYLHYCWDVFVIGIISTVSSVIYWIQEKKSEKAFFLMTVSLLGWFYLIGISLWKLRLIYYLYPSAGMFCLSLCALCKVDSRKIFKYISSMAILVSLLFGSYCSYLNASGTMDVSSSYSDSMDYLFENCKQGDRVLMMNYAVYEEPPYQSNLLNEVLKKNVIFCGCLEYALPVRPSSDVLKSFSLSENDYQKLLAEAKPVPGDYILVYDNKRNAKMPSRAVAPSSDPVEIAQYVDSHKDSLSMVCYETIKRPVIVIDRFRFRKAYDETSFYLYKVNRELF